MIFSNLRTYAAKWQVKNSRPFSAEEIAAVVSASVVPSDYGNSVCFMMVSGGMTYIPLSNTSKLTVGETVDLKSATLLTLSKDGESDIYRVEA